MAKPRIKVPETVKIGEVIEIRAIMQHVMETGNRKDAAGNVVPRNIIHTFTAKYAGKIVFSAQLGPGIASNPSLAFFLKVPGHGQLELTWVDDQNVVTIETTTLNIVDI